MISSVSSQITRWIAEVPMSCLRAILCIIFPPLAVLDRGCGTILIVTLLTLAAWVPGVIAALLLNFMAENQKS
jgi:uncharacterized membrane protein YqaE (UPF0057 family)